jgi:23S rRNA G2445 N2-methylase RlmL
LEEIARAELRRCFGGRLRLLPAGNPPEAGAIRFAYSGNLSALLGLKTALAAYLCRRFPVPRPRGLLGDEHFRALLAQIALVRALAPPETYRTFYLSAAGSESSVMARLKDALVVHTGLQVASHEGDLLLRVRRSPEGEGWEVLVRLSPRPLATRPWRVCNREGALNATVAHAMILLTHPNPEDVFLNLACGSGTLLIERLAAAPARRVIGCDVDPAALECACANVEAAGESGRVELYPWDARALPLPDRSIDVLCADLPFGYLVGSHAENVALYPAILHEAARVARPGARLALITHEVRLMNVLLAESALWSAREVIRVTLGGLHPRIFVLERRQTPA